MKVTPFQVYASPPIEPSRESRGSGVGRPGFTPDHPPPRRRPRSLAFLASLVLAAILAAPVWWATAASAAMTVTLAGASAGQTVTGGLALEARVSGGTPTRVDFTVDGALMQREGIWPYCMGGDGGALPCNAWDSRRVANGQRTVRATAYDAAGGSAAASVTVTVSNTTSSPAPSTGTSLSHLRAFDFVRGIRYIYDAALREKAWQWAAAKLDGLEADGTFSSEMVKRDGTIHPVSYRLDLTACQHQGCRSIYPVDTTVASLPESYYLHFSETTTLDWIKPDGTVVKRVTIPGCPSGTAISKSCRVQLWLWDDARWAFNVNDPGFQNWQANRLIASLKNGQKGMFLDEHAANIIDAWRWGRETKPVSGGGVRELGGNRPSYGTATTLYQTMVVNWMVVLRNKAKAAGKYLMPNLSQEATDAWGIKESLAAGGVSIEFLHRPDAFDGSSGHFERYVQLIKDLVAIGGVADLAGTLCYYGPSGYTAGNYGSSKARYWMWRLAAYYLVREPAGSAARIYFNPGLCTKNWPTDPLGWTKEWLPAYEKSIGSPSGDAYKIKTGSYSYSTSSGTKTCGYRVFARNYTGGMVLVRTKDAWNCTNWGDQSAQTVSLPRSLRVLKEDGTLGTAASTAKIRNGEALVLKNP